MRFAGVVSDAGRLVLHEEASFRATLAKWKGKPVHVEVSVAKPRRSTKANARYWACTVPIIREIWNAAIKAKYPNEPPMDDDETHEAIVRRFWPEGNRHGPFGGILRARTRDMDTAQFAELGQRAESHFTAETGVSFEYGGDGW